MAALAKGDVESTLSPPAANAEPAGGDQVGGPRPAADDAAYAQLVIALAHGIHLSLSVQA